MRMTVSGRNVPNSESRPLMAQSILRPSDSGYLLTLLSCAEKTGITITQLFSALHWCEVLTVVRGDINPKINKFNVRRPRPSANIMGHGL